MTAPFDFRIDYQGRLIRDGFPYARQAGEIEILMWKRIAELEERLTELGADRSDDNRDLPSILAHLRFGDSDGQDHDDVADAVERLQAELLKSHPAVVVPANQTFARWLSPMPIPFIPMPPDTSPLTHQELFSAVHHHASEIVRLTAAVPAQCKPEEKP